VPGTIINDNKNLKTMSKFAKRSTLELKKLLESKKTSEADVKDIVAILKKRNAAPVVAEIPEEDNEDEATLEVDEDLLDEEAEAEEKEAKKDFVKPKTKAGKKEVKAIKKKDKVKKVRKIRPDAKASMKLDLEPLFKKGWTSKEIFDHFEEKYKIESIRWYAWKRKQI
jgi:hypothetical protein